jgi:hypothetical protein
VNRTSMDHAMVRSYLDELDAALRGMPATKARELREQITAHLDDALPPDADDEQVARVLGRLGSPAALAADAGEASAAPPPGRAMIRARLRYRLARVSGRTWSAAGVLVILAGIAAGFLSYYLTPGSLAFGGGSGWWYPQDYNRAVITTADSATQTTVPLRPGERQGYFITIFNPTGVTQTILGPAYGTNVPLDSPASPVVQLGVSVPNLNIEHGGASRSVRFTLPGVIPPGQTREVRVLWISDTCSGAGDTSSVNTLAVRVRVGWFTRTEIIPLDQAWALIGTSHTSCP